jgi:hypothetical protein
MHKALNFGTELSPVTFSAQKGLEVPDAAPSLEGALPGT